MKRLTVIAGRFWELKLPAKTKLCQMPVGLLCSYSVVTHTQTGDLFWNCISSWTYKHEFSCAMSLAVPDCMLWLLCFCKAQNI